MVIDHERVTSGNGMGWARGVVRAATMPMLRAAVNAAGLTGR
jgi:hypothetical protein